MENSQSEQKAAMRRRMRRVRRALAPRREAASHAAAAIADLRRWPLPCVAAGYVASPDEIDPAPLLARLREAGCDIALPVVVGRGEPLVFRRAVPTDRLRPDAAGIPAPPMDSPEVSPTLLICPLLAFDLLGGRLGQGGGYYDRTLAALRARGRILAVGIAYENQQVVRAPIGPNDARLDAILTEIAYREV